MAEALLHALEEAERAWRLSNPAFQAKLAKWNQKNDSAKARQRAAEIAKRQRKTKDDGEDNGGADESTDEFDPDDPSPGFSFANFKTTYSKTELEEDLAGLHRASIKPSLIQALRRGIAVHHDGMNKAYRSLVERYVTADPHNGY